MPKIPVTVMFFIAEYPTFGGSPQVMLNLLRRLPPERVRPVIVFPGEGRTPDVYRRAGLSVSIVEAPAPLNVFGKALIRASPIRQAWLLATAVLRYNRQLAAFMQEHVIDVVHFSTPRGLLLGFLAPLWRRCPIVLHLHGPLTVLGRLLAWVSLTVPDRLLLVSDGLLARVPPHLRHKCAVVTNWCGDERPVEGPSSVTTDRPASDLTVLMASSMIPFKGYHHLLRAVARLNASSRADAPRVTFVAIGETPDPVYERYIAELKTSLAIDNFVHCGWQARPIDFLQAADIVVLPSVEQETLMIDGRMRTIVGNEGFGLVLLEAMALGKPVVASYVIGPPDIVDDGVNGFLVPPGDPVALAGALQRLIDDPLLRSSMGAAALRTATSEKFSPERATRVVMDVYASVA